MLHATQYLHAILINKRTLKKCNALYKYHYTSSIYARLPLLWPSHSLFCFSAFQHSIPAFHRHPTAFWQFYRYLHRQLTAGQPDSSSWTAWTAGQVRSTNRYPIVSSTTSQVCGLLIIIFSLLLPGLILLL